MIAVAIAVKPEETIRWFQRYQGIVAVLQLREALSAIQSAEAFAPMELKLLTSLSSPEVGLQAFRVKNESWLRNRWERELLSQREFEQVVVPLDPARAVILGRAERLQLPESVSMNKTSAVKVLLGDEGVGKTWLVADWWLGLSARPVMIPIMGRLVELINAHDPLGSLAEIIRRQYGEIESSASSWRRRLMRWSKRDTGVGLG